MNFHITLSPEQLAITKVTGFSLRPIPYAPSTGPVSSVPSPLQLASSHAISAAFWDASSRSWARSRAASPSRQARAAAWCS